MEEILNSYWILNKIIGSNKNYIWHKKALINLIDNFFILYTINFPHLDREIFLLTSMLETSLNELDI